MDGWPSDAREVDVTFLFAQAPISRRGQRKVACHAIVACTDCISPIADDVEHHRCQYLCLVHSCKHCSSSLHPDSKAHIF